MTPRRAWIGGLAAAIAGWFAVRAEAQSPGLKVVGGGGGTRGLSSDGTVVESVYPVLLPAASASCANVRLIGQAFGLNFGNATVTVVSGSVTTAHFATNIIGAAGGGQFSWSGDNNLASGTKDTGLARHTQGVVRVSTGGTGAGCLLLHKVSTGYDCAIANGAVTSNTSSGQAVIDRGASSVAVTNSLVTDCSIIMAVLGVNDSTALYVRSVIILDGSFTIHTSANTTAATCVRWWLVN